MDKLLISSIGAIFLFALSSVFFIGLLSGNSVSLSLSRGVIAGFAAAIVWGLLGYSTFDQNNTKS
jgi:VIT1/CCC1 family predicted Fe2+/Mn2+ transporter